MTGLIIALDQPDLPKAEHLAAQLKHKVSAFKVGLTLFSAYGPEAILEIAQHAPVFCDLKLHDIPNQVRFAVAELKRQKVWLATVHASGGSEMVSAAVEAAEGSPLIAAVTVLTSIDTETLISVGQGDDPKTQVLLLARLAVDAGVPALVCSAEEVAAVRAEVGEGIVLVVPGIRPLGESTQDQARVSTPAAASKAGADYLVVGRPVTEAPDPIAAVERLIEEIA
ncbi:MAG: orotidine-5'-phosphate decarboxylase [Actinomycetota bacterium]